jgi:hypothetical protein
LAGLRSDLPSGFALLLSALAMSLAILLLFLAAHSPQSPYILEYHCDSGWGDLSHEVCSAEDTYANLTRSFTTKQEAIDWIDTNFVFAPGSLLHGSVTLECSVTYLNPDSDDLWESHKKDVECGAQHAATDTPEINIRLCNAFCDE